MRKSNCPFNLIPLDLKDLCRYPLNLKDLCSYTFKGNAGNAYPSGAPDFTPVFYGVHVVPFPIYVFMGGCAFSMLCVARVEASTLIFV